MALSANAEVDRQDGELQALPVLTNTQIYKGAIIGEDSSTGYARGLVAADVFLGIAYENVDNNPGDSGALDVRVWRKGVFLLTGSGFAQTSVGAKIYASADDTITLTSSSNSLIGSCVKYVSATQVWVDIDVQPA
jgi:predicted RecA/RadA family phage recombinase